MVSPVGSVKRFKMHCILRSPLATRAPTSFCTSGYRRALLANWILQKSQSVATPAVLAILQVQQDRLFVRIYEDNVAGKLDDGRFAMMSKNYTEEQKNLSLIHISEPTRH